MNQLCKVCGEPAAGFHFGAFTCEGCKSFFGRTYNNLSSISECKNNGECIINKKNRTTCKACRLRKCLMVGMSKSGSRYGRRSNWFKIHCLLQEQQQAAANAAAANPHGQMSQMSHAGHPVPGHPAHPAHPSAGVNILDPTARGSIPPGLELFAQNPLPPPHPDLAGFFAHTFASTLHPGNPFLSSLYRFPTPSGSRFFPTNDETIKNSPSDTESVRSGPSSRSKSPDEDKPTEAKRSKLDSNGNKYESYDKCKFVNNNNEDEKIDHRAKVSDFKSSSVSPSSDPGCIFGDKKQSDKQFSPPPERVTVSSLSWPSSSFFNYPQPDAEALSLSWKDVWLRNLPVPKIPVPEPSSGAGHDEPIDLSVKSSKCDNCDGSEDGTMNENNNVIKTDKTDDESVVKTVPLDLSKDTAKGSQIVSS